MGIEKNVKGKRQELSGVWSLRIHGGGISPFQSEDLVEVKDLSSDWLLCFSDLQFEPHLSLGFYYSCSRFIFLKMMICSYIHFS